MKKEIIRKSGTIYKKDYNDITHKLTRIENEIRDRITFLCKEYPECQISGMYESLKSYGFQITDIQIKNIINDIIEFEEWIKTQNSQYIQSKINF